MTIFKHLGCVISLFVLSAACSAGEDGSGSTESAVATTKESLQLPISQACASSSQCPLGSHCTTEDGVCNRPPGCKPTDICPDLCYGTCVGAVTFPPPVNCGGKTCGPGTYCCNASCGVCAPRGAYCTQQVCLSPL